MIFEEFARVSGLLEPGSIVESRIPPEPDVLLRLPSGQGLAFELVEVIDRDYSRSVQRGFSTKDACLAYLEGLRSDAQSEFKEKYRNADIFLSFRPELTTRRRRKALPAIFQKLSELPSDAKGDVFIEDPELEAFIEYASINRGRFVGPLFDTTEVVSVGDPTLEAIESKMDKTYKTPNELSLLAYIETNPMFPDDVWLTDLAEFGSQLGLDCQFKNIFVFDWQLKQVRYKWSRNS